MNAFDLTGLVAIVTSGNGEIGLGMAHGLAQAGAGLMIVGRDQNKTTNAIKETMAQDVNVASVAADLADEAASRSDRLRAEGHNVRNLTPAFSEMIC